MPQLDEERPGPAAAMDNAARHQWHEDISLWPAITSGLTGLFEHTTEIAVRTA